MVLERRTVVHCGACGMPPEYCEYGPDYETHCLPWLKENHPEDYARLKALRKNGGVGDSDDEDVDGKDVSNNKPSRPWTTEERLHAFYTKYQPDKLDGIGKILEKYEGKEENLFKALVKKYGSEPDDPYYPDSDDDSDEADDDELNTTNNMEGLSLSGQKKRRGAAAKRVNKVDTRIVIQKVSRNKRKAVTIVVGMDTVPDIKLKDVAKAFSKKFAGSSSVKDTAAGKKEIIIQGDHMDEVAAMVVKKFKVPADSVFLDIDGDFVPFK
uniref:SUI1 domain-containing protein n=1 Tax=Eucampia antarctica TaxID=49252 RepID=A0A7S2SHC7_9STRA|mmetsp:Transcript_7886/g.7482  ORF Transcript_7886/g.7482 Transcript_7886/m.7482 type:complete len:268 (+) Transcript_7886:58-861(+)|eukprot:CAMPEP_0197827874 /NCGR_PEP_ID=MMETSP1437-20131217/4561_1 /TAXON_ID=49252 ORGANISM="Eucampia antarctica, Strain CCMP1452" /NCGR_SAMPLE_ID=MMETSP1437 /ASSEMBLY_ACC=CAM_ASM_001096 /LENGTH=267 /DNA_ID=CAMNT_0043428887 /DNA_START=53 /DNA_END=856 /DNA_ORIENTATION=+